MNTNFKTVTLPELFNDLFTPVSYKNFIPRYRTMLLDAVAGQNEKAGSNRNPDVIEAAASEVERLAGARS